MNLHWVYIIQYLIDDLLNCGLMVAREAHLGRSLDRLSTRLTLVIYSNNIQRIGGSQYLELKRIPISI
jgi:hypothetical protein